MQKHNNHEIVAKYWNGHPISAVYHGTQLVWMAVRSCFGSGVWMGDKPWLDNEKWKS